MSISELNEFLDRPFALLDSYVEFRRRGFDPFDSCAELIHRGTGPNSIEKYDRRLAELERIDAMFSAAAARNGRTPCAPEGAPVPARRPGRPSKESGIQFRHPGSITDAERAERRKYERAHAARMSSFRGV